jgi:hypothetical protein
MHGEMGLDRLTRRESGKAGDGQEECIYVCIGERAREDRIRVRSEEAASMVGFENSQ